VYLCSNGCGGEGYDKKAKVLKMRARVDPQDRRCPAVPQVQERVLECGEESQIVNAVRQNLVEGEYESSAWLGPSTSSSRAILGSHASQTHLLSPKASPGIRSASFFPVRRFFADIRYAIPGIAGLDSRRSLNLACIAINFSSNLPGM